MSDVNPKTVLSTFSDLPEDCIAHIISLTSPKDACRVAAVSKGFKSAADSGTVWQRFLPHNCNELVSRASPQLVFETKKQLYFLLLNSEIFLDGGKMCFTFTEHGTRFVMGAKALQIAEIDNPAHWEWFPTKKSSFGEVARIKSIDRFEIRGIMPARMLSPNTHYSAWFMYWCSRNERPSKASVKFGREDGTEIEVEKSTVFLGRQGTWEIIFDDERGRVPWRMPGDWYGIEMGSDFVIGVDEENFEIHLEVTETEHLNVEKDLCIHGIMLDVIFPNL